MSAIDSFVDHATGHDGSDPETDDCMIWALGGGVILEGPNGEWLQCKRPADVREWV